jgi:hypothetical protein
MKILNRSIAILLFVVRSFYSEAQQLVQSPNDLLILCQKDNQFIGKPLTSLLMEIKPSIKIVFAQGGWAEQAPAFFFYFMSRTQFDSCRSKGTLPLRLVVYVKEYFQWSYQERRKTRKDFISWTKEDTETYGNLTVLAIRISGQCDPCNDASDAVGY